MEYADRDGYVTTYYGTYNINKPITPIKQKVHYFMLEEYIRQTVEKQKEEFKVDMKRILEDFSKCVTNKILDDKFTKMADDNRKLLNAIIELNNLERPMQKKPRVNAIKKSKGDDMEVLTEIDDQMDEDEIL